MNNIIYTNKQEFDKKLQNMKLDGIDKLHVLTDFDNTLTKAFIDGKRTPSLLSVLRENNDILGKDFAIEDIKLFEKFHPIEIDSTISILEKNKQMENWWKGSFELLIKYRLTKQKEKQVVDLGNIEFRDGVKEFLNYLNEYNIPLIIISASGLGVESIKYFFKKNKVFYGNIEIISNDFIWDKNGKAIGYKKPIIHSFNKGETILKEFPEIYKKIKNRKNVILLGDSLGDHHMVDGFDYKNLINIGFLNDKVDELIEEYKKRYDIVITGDGNFGIVNKNLDSIK